MAKIEEADPRWIVAERADGTNVNNWHWVEKDCLPWSKQRLNQLFIKLDLVDQSQEQYKAQTTQVSQVEGEAFLNVRKKILIPTYELEIKIDWIGSNSGKEIKGQIHLPYVAEENQDEDPEIKIILFENSSEAEQLKQVILKQGKNKIINAIKTFTDEFHAGKAANSAGDNNSTTQEPKNSSTTNGNENSNSQTKNPANNKNSNNNSNEQQLSQKKQNGKGRSIRIQDRFYASSRDLFDCFTNENRVQAYTQSPAKIEVKVGGEFSMYGGSICGVFRELTEGKLIVMDWRFNDWEDGVFSRVEIQFVEKEPGNTQILLEQNGIPEEDKYGNVDVVGRVEQGWQQQVFFRIKAVFGYGI